MTRPNTLALVAAALVLLPASGTLLADGALLSPGAPLVRSVAPDPAETVATGSVDADDPASVGELYATGVVFGWRETGFGRWLMKQHSELALWPLFANGPML